LAEEINERDSKDEPVVNPLEGGFHYEDEHGSITIHEKSLRKLEIKNGDVIIIKRFDGLSVDLIEWIANELGDRGLGDCIVVVADRLSDFKVVDEKVMNNYGWYRKPE
jgi:hypothetical protein